MAKKPVRYQRVIPGTVLQSVSLLNELKTGQIVSFQYGTKQNAGEVGGWKNDPKPRLLVFYDDGQKYIEGINTNYLPTNYLVVLMKLLVSFPGINGIDLYSIVKKSAPKAILKGYRKYIRTSVMSPVVNEPYRHETAPKTTKKLVSKKPIEAEKPKLSVKPRRMVQKKPRGTT